MAANEILVERQGQGLVVKFNRPDSANAMTLDMATQLHNVLKSVTVDRSVRAVLLCGSGPDFMNGLDMGVYTHNLTTALEEANKIILPYHSAIRELQTMDKPVLAAVDGYVTGSGMSFMLASDFVISGRNAKFNCRFTDYATTPDGGCSFFLPRKIGLARAIEMMMFCEEIDCKMAERLHLVNRVAEDGTLMDEALKWLDHLANGPTKAYGAVKKLATRAFEETLDQHLGLEHTYNGQSSRSFDFREAVKAHSEGRKAKFSGT